MKNIFINILAAFFLLSILLLHGCGGGGSSNGTGGTTITSTNGLVVESKLAEGVRMLSPQEAKLITNVEPNQIVFSSDIGLKDGSIFIYNDIAYKVIQIARQANGNLVAAIRTPELEEVFERLRIEGEVSFSPENVEGLSKKTKLSENRVSDKSETTKNTFTLSRSTSESGEEGIKAEGQYSRENNEGGSSKLSGSISAYKTSIKILFDCGKKCTTVPEKNDFEFASRIINSLEANANVKSSNAAFPAIEQLLWEYLILFPQTGFTVGMRVPIYFEAGAEGNIDIKGKAEADWSVGVVKKTGESLPSALGKLNTKSSGSKPDDVITVEGKLDYSLSIIPKPKIAVLGIGIVEIEAKNGVTFTGTAKHSITNPTGGACLTLSAKGKSEAKIKRPKFGNTEFSADLLSLLGINPVFLPELKLTPTLCDENSTQPVPSVPPPNQPQDQFGTDITFIPMPVTLSAKKNKECDRVNNFGYPATFCVYTIIFEITCASGCANYQAVYLNTQTVFRNGPIQNPFPGTTCGTEHIQGTTDHTIPTGAGTPMFYDRNTGKLISAPITGWRAGTYDNLNPSFCLFGAEEVTYTVKVSSVQGGSVTRDVTLSIVAP